MADLTVGGDEEGEDSSELMPITGSSIGTGMPNANNQPTVHPKSGNIIIGYDNYVDGTAERIIIVGVENSVGAFCQNVSIFNSSGCVVVGGLSDVHIVNSIGITVTESNQSYSNGVLTPSWTLLGNAGTVDETNFIGTTDDIPFVTKTNNIERMRVAGNGFVGIGINNPKSVLSVVGSVTIADGSQGVNKVLTSDEDGLATWEAAGGGGLSQQEILKFVTFRI